MNAAHTPDGRRWAFLLSESVVFGLVLSAMAAAVIF